MIFVLDNYDSFTYNLVQYIGELGEEVEVRRNDQVTVREVEAMRPERVVNSSRCATRSPATSANRYDGFGCGSSHTAKCRA